METTSSLIEVQALEGHTDRVWSVAWAPSGKLLASCSGDKSVRIWALQSGDAEKWTCQAVIDDGHTRTIRCCDWSPCGRYLATAGFDSVTSIWEYYGAEFDCLASLEGHENEVKSVCWNKDGTLMATCSRDRSVWIWAHEQNDEFECVSVLSGHTQDVKCVKFHPRRNILVSASYDDTIKIWKEDEDGDDWHCVQTLSQQHNCHTSTIWSLSFNKLGDKMVSCSDDLSLIIWDTSFDFHETDRNLDAEEKDERDEEEEEEKACHLEREKDKKIDKSNDKTNDDNNHGNHIDVKLNNEENDEKGIHKNQNQNKNRNENENGNGNENNERFGWKYICKVSDCHSRTIYSVDWSHLNGLIASGSGDDSIRIFTPKFDENNHIIEVKLEAAKEKAHDTDVNCVKWHPQDGKILASAGDDGLIKIWKLQSNDIVRSI